MRINIISVGKLDKNHNVIADSYRKMIASKLVETEIIYSKKIEPEAIRKFEAKLISEKLSPGAVLCILDESGKQYSSHELAKILQQTMLQSKDIDFIIGGAYGLDRELIKKAKIHLSLSAMTLPHQLVKVILLEQIYRAESIMKGHPYHK